MRYARRKYRSSVSAVSPCGTNTQFIAFIRSHSSSKVPWSRMVAYEGVPGYGVNFVTCARSSGAVRMKSTVARRLSSASVGWPIIRRPFTRMPAARVSRSVSSMRGMRTSCFTTSRKRSQSSTTRRRLTVKRSS